ncbi:thiamin/thiamin pyrophosphate ABC transporter, thiamin/thiamin pyrophospate-bind [Hahella chejuensis KCTC 2396]|uniref:Thiamine-binding periplasmic protein n=1 Tax=Hahella chejuensis (strain KCTC 2396) TaxID=349521 RepID=Q2SLK5_HAHCH|nr:thiamine ABC transporter substrate binding subunit [Hahella chejuensis]ABC28469.1 thiamin/thiamin pyrophosphate ABC transporter, thiamin/thiamin pyrophospate-bind [Hahella chejuensis KCTC 2396]
MHHLFTRAVSFSRLAHSLIAVSAAAFAASASAAEELTVYTYDSFVSEWGPGPALEKGFEATCQCDVKFVALEDGVSILNRLRIEGKKAKADVVLGLDTGLIEETRKEGLVQPHAVAFDALTPELKWSDKDFVPFDYGYFSFIYDSQKIKQPAQSLQELVDSSASVIYQDPRTSTPGQGMMMWMKSAYGDQAESAWKKLAQHTVTVTKGWWEAYSMFLEGDADYVLSYSTSPAYHQVAEDKTQYKAALFSEGHVMQVEVAAIAANSEKKELANRFLNFLISQEAQEIIPVTNWMLPVRKGVKLPEAFDTLIQPKSIELTPEYIAANRKAWIKEWRGAVSQ